jgi:hypothetical protein
MKRGGVMSFTNYDVIWTEFIENCQTDDINLPDMDDKIYEVIHSAVRHYNTRLHVSLTYDDILEQVNKDLVDWEIVLLAHYLRLSFLENQLIHLSSMWSPFQKDIGIKNYQEQSRNLKELIDREDSKIEGIITQNFTDDYM